MTKYEVAFMYEMGGTALECETENEARNVLNTTIIAINNGDKMVMFKNAIYLTDGLKYVKINTYEEDEDEEEEDTSPFRFVATKGN